MLLSKLVSLDDMIKDINTVGGLDVSYFNVGDLEYGVGVLVILGYPELKLQRCFYAIRRVCVPYIPGLLAFREMEVLAPVLAYGLSEVDVNLLVVDGHGIAHPRGFGIASHIGLAFRKPSIGVAKRLLVGREDYRDGVGLVVYENRVVGAILETRWGKLYVSPGYGISVETSLKLVRTMMKPGSKLPEPTRLADEISKRVKPKSIPNKDLEIRECTKLVITTFTS